jgi:hypothetical protein
MSNIEQLSCNISFLLEPSIWWWSKASKRAIHSRQIACRIYLICPSFHWSFLCALATHHLSPLPLHPCNLPSCVSSCTCSLPMATLNNALMVMARHPLGFESPSCNLQLALAHYSSRSWWTNARILWLLLCIQAPIFNHLELRVSNQLVKLWW